MSFVPWPLNIYEGVNDSQKWQSNGCNAKSENRYFAGILFSACTKRIYTKAIL